MNKICENIINNNESIYSELIIALVAPVGTNTKPVIDSIQTRLNAYQYKTNEESIIKVSKLIPRLEKVEYEEGNQYQRINNYMTAGNNARNNSKDFSVLALATASKIYELRQKESNSGTNLKPLKKQAFIIDSLKHPDEVLKLREIYGNGFYLIGIFSDVEAREKYLREQLLISEENAKNLMERDEYEGLDYGQQTRDTFQLSDIFIYLDYSTRKLNNDITRVFDLIFSNPFITPTFDEYAMFMAQASAMRSADLSRQIGAVIAKNNEIIASGVNDCPKYGGGLYWPIYDKENEKYVDFENGRDYTRCVKRTEPNLSSVNCAIEESNKDYIKGFDSNKFEQERIINSIIKNIQKEISYMNEGILKEILKNSDIKDLTEYGRVVHAEMEALLFCARNNISSKNATIYSTTFPCHNCAKHIIAAGIKRVVYIEPYPKSKAIQFHDESISLGFNDDSNKVNFEPFIGVGPRRFFDLFSIKSNAGLTIKRKEKDGSKKEWNPENAPIRTRLLPVSYIDQERIASIKFYDIQKGENE